MTPLQIKILLITNNKTVTQLANACEKRLRRRVSREQVSMCIHRRRKYDEIRRALADELGVSVDQLFGSDSNKNVN